MNKLKISLQARGCNTNAPSSDEELRILTDLTQGFYESVGILNIYKEFNGFVNEDPTSLVLLWPISRIVSENVEKCNRNQLKFADIQYDADIFHISSVISGVFSMSGEKVAGSVNHFMANVLANAISI